MATNLKIDGNFFVLTDVDTTSEIYRIPRSISSFRYENDVEDVFVFESLNSLRRDRESIAFTDIIDGRTGLAFNSVSELSEFLALNLGAEIEVVEQPEVANGKVVFVSSKNDFPTAESSVITLIDNITYFIAADIDLNGDRLVGGSDTTIIGGSSENCSITSTGLGVGVPLFTTEWTTQIRHITFKDVDTAIAINGNINPPVALDWTGVNFLNVPEIGIIQNCSNFIFTKGAFINSGGISFDGTIGTVAFNNSLFDCDSANTIFDLQAGLTITRRFRIIYSSIIALSGETAISLNASATIPNEGIILDTCNFSGGGTYLTGIDFQDNEALFVNNVGITNSKEIAQYYMNGNATVTTVSSSGVAYKVAGTTINGALTSKFTHTNNRATYTGSITRPFYVTATLSVESGNNNVIGIYISKNGTILTDSEVYITTNAGGRAEAATVQTLTTLEDTDYIEIFVENDTSTTNITVTDLNVIIQ